MMGGNIQNRDKYIKQLESEFQHIERLHRRGVEYYNNEPLYIIRSAIKAEIKRLKIK